MGNRQPASSAFRENIADYFSAPASPFYRVFNFEWKHVEGEANAKAGAFTPAERSRLRSLVEMAHRQGYWIRFWTLNTNFGSREALEERWRAARQAGADSLATDEYELAGEFLR